MESMDEEDSEDDEEDDSKQQSEGSVASAMEASGSEDGRDDDEQPIRSEDADTGEDDLFNSTAARKPAQNRRIEKVLDHCLVQQGREPGIYKKRSTRNSNDIPEQHSGECTLTLRLQNFSRKTPSE